MRQIQIYTLNHSQLGCYDTFLNMSLFPKSKFLLDFLLSPPQILQHLVYSSNSLLQFKILPTSHGPMTSHTHGLLTPFQVGNKSSIHHTMMACPLTPIFHPLLHAIYTPSLISHHFPWFPHTSALIRLTYIQTFLPFLYSLAFHYACFTLRPQGPPIHVIITNTLVQPTSFLFPSIVPLFGDAYGVKILHYRWNHGIWSS